MARADTTHERPKGRTDADPLMQGFGFLGGAVAWTLHFMISYGLTEIDCRSERLAFEFLGLPGLHVLGLVLTLVAALTAAAATFTAATAHPRGWAWKRMDPADAHESEGRSRFLAFTGTIMSGLFTLAVLTNGSSFILLRACS